MNKQITDREWEKEFDRRYFCPNEISKSAIDKVIKSSERK